MSSGPDDIAYFEGYVHHDDRSLHSTSALEHCVVSDPLALDLQGDRDSQFVTNEERERGGRGGGESSEVKSKGESVSYKGQITWRNWLYRIQGSLSSYTNIGTCSAAPCREVVLVQWNLPVMEIYKQTSRTGFCYLEFLLGGAISLQLSPRIFLHNLHALK